MLWPGTVTGKRAASRLCRPMDDDVVDLGRLDAGPLDGLVDGMAGHGR
jgi:hypothetical protein